MLGDNSEAIQDIVVLPLYQSSYGIGFGPDGRGLQSSSKVFTKPFRFNSGEDIMSKQIQGRGIIIPPFIFIGTSKNVNHWLFMKKSYIPIAVHSSQIYGASPIVMKPSRNDENKKYVELLLSEKPDQYELKKLFKASYLKEDIKMELDTNDVSLLKSISQ